ncbi:MAG TPA: L-seryl-tRNA(Sec) selenium transferase [Myxococcota bacterium]|nr:L-seryl-tRNA(Sec) selenium transferase [Myxococcota bacterium]
MNSERPVKPDLRRSLPPVDRLARALEIFDTGFPRWAALQAARDALSEARAAMSSASAPPSLEALAEVAARRARDLSRPHPGRVVNATGIVLHTNLGRAPLASGAAQAIARAACGYTDLELDLDSGDRGSRSDAAVEKLRMLAGVPDAVVVNNNAAALLLVLATLARDREVIVSRGELVEIGGSFRVPEILASAGARLVEVGTTNRTHLSDYERAIGPSTAVLLKVHRSNFSQHGFVAEAGLPELASLARMRGLVVVEDLGSGTLIDLSEHGLPAESFAPTRLRAGAEIVCFSGDKLLGGPQAGIALTASETHAQAMRRNPLARALRLDKLALAGLDWTLSSLLDGRAQTELPVLRRLLEPEAELERRARALAERIRRAGEGLEAEAMRDVSYAGGGALPELALATWVVALRAPIAAGDLSQRLRRGHPPVLGRIRDDRVILDLRSLEPEDEKPIEEALRSVLR